MAFAIDCLAPHCSFDLSFGGSSCSYADFVGRCVLGLGYLANSQCLRRTRFDSTSNSRSIDIDEYSAVNLNLTGPPAQWRRKSTVCT